MKVTREKIEDRQVFLTIEMEPSEVAPYVEESFKRLAHRVNIPGFRKGKAPRAVLERYLRKEAVLEDSLDRLLPKAYEQALKEQDIKAFDQPQIEVTQTEPVIFKATVPLPPEVKPGDYHSIRATPEVVNVTDEQIDSVVERLRHRQGSWELVERPIEFGDRAKLNIDSTVEGKPFITDEGADYIIVRDSTFPAPGFAEQLVGMKKDEEKEVKLPLAADYPRKEIAGKEVTFEVKVLEIKHEVLPELNDDFAKKVDAKKETLEALRVEIADELKKAEEERIKRDFEEQVIEAVVGVSQLEFPPILLEAEVERLIEDQARRLELQGIRLEDYLKRINKTPEQLHEELHPVAHKRVTQTLVLEKIAETEKVEVSEAELDAEIQEMLKTTTSENREKIQEALNTPRSRESLKRSLVIRKTVQRLVEIAKSPPVETKAKEEDKK